MKDYSQGGEQAVILNALRGLRGRLLDIGAAGPGDFSNTRALIDEGWTGVLVEPSPSLFFKLIEHYQGRPEIELVQAVIASSQGWIDFWDSCGDLVSTIVPHHVEKWKSWNNLKYRKFAAYAITPSMLLDRAGSDFLFINIDTEATSAALFGCLPLERLTACRCICVEHDNCVGAILDKARKFGFKQIWSSQENLILWR